jgi:hypothetical protein
MSSGPLIKPERVKEFIGGPLLIHRYLNDLFRWEGDTQKPELGVLEAKLCREQQEASLFIPTSTVGPTKGPTKPY